MTDTIGRIPVTIVEIDQKKCVLDYGVGLCTAQIGVTGTDKCFNTLASCQVVSAYDDTDNDLTLRFAKPHGDLPKDMYIIPSVRSVSTIPTRINVGGRAGRDKPLGRRAEASISIQDHPHSDLLVDPYLSDRSYDPLDRSTFWAKWLKRNPFHNGWDIRVLEGYADQSLAEYTTRNYIIDKIEGPDSNGSISIKATDILRLADNDKAKIPALSNGKLLSDITAAATSLTVTGGSLAEYTLYNTDFVRISDEVIGYATVADIGSGNLLFSGLTRGEYGTEAATHSADDTVQACYLVDSSPPWELARDLLLEADVPSSYIPYSDWTTECEFWLTGLTVTNILTEPMGITEILGELTEQCMFFIWWDERAKEIKLKSVHPESTNVPLITEDNHLIQNSVKIKIKPELRASEVWVSFLPKDYSEDMEKRGNFKRTNARILSNNPYGERRVYEVYSQWLETDAQVNLLSFRLLDRYSAPPKYLNFSLDAKDKAIGVGDVFDVEYRGFSNFTGEIELKRYQVLSAHESPPGERVIIESQEFDFEIGFRNGFFMASTAPSYADATEEEKNSGCFFSDDAGELPDGSDGYVYG